MKKVVFYGDSITQGFNMLDKHKNVVNLGRNGDKISDLICRFFELMDEMPERIFVMIGINDLLVSKGYWQRQINIDFVTLYFGLLALLRDNIPHKDVVLLSILPICIDHEETLSWNYEIDAYNVFIKGQAESLGYRYLDLNTHFKNGYNLMCTEYSSDGVHLNEKGYELLYKQIKAELS